MGFIIILLQGIFNANFKNGFCFIGFFIIAV